MKKQLGVWLDGKEAYIISAEQPGDYKHIESAADFRERVDGEGKDYGRFGDQFIDHERQKERRLEKQLSRYIDAIVEEINDANEIVVFGPSTAKKRLEKAIRDHHLLKDRLVAVETADPMTENQMKAWVRNFYHVSKD